MNYEEKYNKAVESIKRIYEQASSFGKELMEKEFPELHGLSETEIIENLYRLLCAEVSIGTFEKYGLTDDAVFSWLEMQGEQKPVKSEQNCYHDDGLYYAIDILEKTFGKVEGYQSDDGIIEHQTAIETVNALYHKKPTEWSEEDESMLFMCSDAIAAACAAEYYTTEEMIKMQNWLKSLKDRVQPQPTSEWNEESELMFNSFLHKLEVCDLLSNKEITWIKNKLKSIKHWKPSEKQMEELEYVTKGNSYPHLSSLYQDLKTL